MESTELTNPLINNGPEIEQNQQIIDIPDSWCCIYRVPQSLREVNKDAYTPKLISIGPFHHGKEELKDMETLKSKYFVEFCERTMTEPQAITSFIANRETEIRHCYEGSLEFTSKDFVKIVELDSIFIIEYFAKATTAEGENENNNNKEREVSNPWFKAHIMLDLILLENQIPFFILDQLYNEFYRSNNVAHSFLAKKTNDAHSFLNLAYKCFRRYLFPEENENLHEIEKNNVKHFTEKNVKHFTDLIRCIYYPSELTTGGAVSNLNSATKLYETGVRFEGIKEGRFDEIKSKNLGKCQCFSWLLIFLPCLKIFPCLEPMESLLYLPCFVANKRTEDLFRNIMALERFHYPSKAYLCNYMVLLDHLINTSEDVELFVDKGIIVNALGSYQEVADMVNKIALEVVEEKSCYSDVAENLNKHHKNDCNHSIGYLKSTYFSNLWRSTAAVVGFIVLGFTIWDFVG